MTAPAGLGIHLVGVVVMRDHRVHCGGHRLGRSARNAKGNAIYQAAPETETQPIVEGLHNSPHVILGPLPSRFGRTAFNAATPNRCGSGIPTLSTRGNGDYGCSGGAVPNPCLINTARESLAIEHSCLSDFLSCCSVPC